MSGTHKRTRAMVSRENEQRRHGGRETVRPTGATPPNQVFRLITSSRPEGKRRPQTTRPGVRTSLNLSSYFTKEPTRRIQLAGPQHKSPAPPVKKRRAQSPRVRRYCCPDVGGFQTRQDDPRVSGSTQVAVVEGVGYWFLLAFRVAAGTSRELLAERRFWGRMEFRS